MKYLLLSDIHGRDLDPLDELIAEKDPDFLICCGDLDRMHSIRQTKALVERFKEERDGAIIVPGNHDHALYAKLNITSGTLREQGTSFSYLQQELEENEECKTFIEELLEPRDGPTPHSAKHNLDKEYSAIVVHGGLTGDFSDYPDCPEHIRDLWYRLFAEEEYIPTAEIMDDHKVNVLLRGHDHKSIYVTVDKYDAIQRHVPIGEESFTLDPEKKNIITIGSYYDGWCAILSVEDDEAELTYRRV